MTKLSFFPTVLCHVTMKVTGRVMILSLCSLFIFCKTIAKNFYSNYTVTLSILDFQCTHGPNAWLKPQLQKLMIMCLRWNKSQIESNNGGCNWVGICLLLLIQFQIYNSFFLLLIQHSISPTNWTCTKIVGNQQGRAFVMWDISPSSALEEKKWC